MNRGYWTVVGGVGTALGIAFWIGACVVGWHFIEKYW